MVTNDGRYKASQDYWYYAILRWNQSASATDPNSRIIGTPLWDLTITNLVTFGLIILTLAGGIRVSGKVVYVTATFPYIVLIILFIFVMTLDGMSDGINYYLTGPEGINPWSKLGEIEVWTAAITQVFYSLGVGFAGIFTMASFNKIDNNFARDTLIVTIGNCLTSFFSGFVIFGMLGAMANLTEQSVEDLADSGPGLIFMSYPSAIALFPGKQFWAVLFFLMMITLAWDSQAVLVETVVAGIIDYWPVLRKHRIYILTTTCMILFLMRRGRLPLTLCIFRFLKHKSAV